MRCLTETTGWIVPRQTEGICREIHRGAKNDSHTTQPLVSVKRGGVRCQQAAYLFTGRVFLIQHIKLPISRPRKISEPTASDTVSNTDPASVNTNTRSAFLKPSGCLQQTECNCLGVPRKPSLCKKKINRGKRKRQRTLCRI